MLGQSIQNSRVPTERSCEFRKLTYGYLLRSMWHGREEDSYLLHDSLLAMVFACEVEEQSSESSSHKNNPFPTFRNSLIQKVACRLELS